MAGPFFPHSKYKCKSHNQGQVMRRRLARVIRVLKHTAIVACKCFWEEIFGPLAGEPEYKEEGKNCDLCNRKVY